MVYNANIWGILMVNITIYSIHGSYGLSLITYNKSDSAEHVLVAPAQVHCSFWVIVAEQHPKLGLGPENVNKKSVPFLNAGLVEFTQKHLGLT